MKLGVLRFGFVIVYNPLHFSGILLLPMPETLQGALLTWQGWYSEDAVERPQDSSVERVPVWVHGQCDAWELVPPHITDPVERPA
jgi:hypothetical protein